MKTLSYSENKMEIVVLCTQNGILITNLPKLHFSNVLPSSTQIFECHHKDGGLSVIAQIASPNLSVHKFDLESSHKY